MEPAGREHGRPGPDGMLPCGRVGYETPRARPEDHAPNLRRGMTQPTVAFIGAGSVACSLAPALAEAGYPVTAVASRTPASARLLTETLPAARACDGAQEAARLAEVVFVTTPDAEVARIAATIEWDARQQAIHCSGAHGAGLLGDIRAKRGVFHPIQTFPTRNRVPLQGCYAGIQGDADALPILEGMVDALGMHAIRVPPEQTALYHAAAVIASNYTVVLMDLAASLWSPMGIGREQAVRALLPLMSATIENLATTGLPRALTGPVARGDVETVARHLDALREHAPDMLAVYQNLAKHALVIAQQKGTITLGAADELRRLLPD